jgi:putative transposase
MTKRVPASMRTRETLSSLIEGRLSSPDGRSELDTRKNLPLSRLA